jgi:hypothetical protein
MPQIAHIGPMGVDVQPRHHFMTARRRGRDYSARSSSIIRA